MQILRTLSVSDCDLMVSDEWNVKISLAIFADDLTIYTLPCVYDFNVISVLYQNILIAVAVIIIFTIITIIIATEIIHHCIYFVHFVSQKTKTPRFCVLPIVITIQ